MVWTRLLHMSLPQAFQRTRITSYTMGTPISGRYKGELRKSFRLNGVPWLYEQPSTVLNPRDKKPKGHKRQLNRPMELAKIQKALLQVEEKKLAYRTERLNKKPLAGFDKFVTLTLPSFIKKENKEIPKHLQKRNSSGDFDD